MSNPFAMLVGLPEEVQALQKAVVEEAAKRRPKSFAAEMAREGIFLRARGTSIGNKANRKPSAAVKKFVPSFSSPWDALLLPALIARPGQATAAAPTARRAPPPPPPPPQEAKQPEPAAKPKRKSPRLLKSKEEKLANRRERDRKRREKKRQGQPPHSALEYAWNDPAAVKLLGTKPDREVAKTLGISEPSVSAARRRRKIPSHHETTVAGRWNEKTLAMLGTMSDVKLAKQIGSTRSIVRDKRNELGIAPYSTTKKTTP